MHLAAYELSLGEQTRIIQLGMYAPADGTYTLALSDLPADISVCLTHGGLPVWDMTAGAAILPLSAGDNSGYALSLRRLPQAPTGIDVVSTEAGVQKVLWDDKLYILRNGNMYSVTGVQVQ